MTIESRAEFENALRSLTEWSGETGDLWRKAAATLPPHRSGLIRLVAARPLSAAVAACLMLAFSTTLVMVFTPTLSRAREHANVQSGFVSPEYRAGESRKERVAKSDAQGDYKLRVGIAEQSPAEKSLDDRRELGDSARQVIRKASVELKTNDVRAVQLRIAHLLHEGAGEFIQDSSTSGDASNPQAHVTLRVAADRLGALLTEIREFGEVVSEKIEGEDVTGQVVDLDARLNNEQRVEQELLELLASKKDAPLTDIMAVRSSLGQVRQSIEQMRAQRQRLGKLVDLATVLVIIGHKNENPASRPVGLGAYFLDQLSSAWNHALRRLADTVVGFMWVLVSGAVWWALVLALCWYLARRLRNHEKRAAAAT